MNTKVGPKLLLLLLLLSLLLLILLLLLCHCPVCSTNRAAAMEEAEGARNKSAATRERDAITTKS